MSPWADLTLSGESITAKAAVDPALTPEGLRRRAVDYVAAGDRRADLVSPIFADLTGLPPLLIQAGSHEILLDDATRLAARAAAADVAVTLEVTPGVPHVFQGVRRDARRRRRRPDQRRRVPARTPRWSASMRAQARPPRSLCRADRRRVSSARRMQVSLDDARALLVANCEYLARPRLVANRS